MQFLRTIALASLIFLAGHVDAQISDSSLAVAQHITYQKALPHSVSRLMPRGARSLFWGTFTPQQGAELMAIHFFFIKTTTEESEDRNYQSTFYHYGLDVFKSVNKKWSKLSSSLIKEFGQPPSILYPKDWSEDTVDTNFYWVDKAKSIPLISLYDFVHGDYGPVGTTYFASFAHGWKSPAMVQTQPQGGSNSGGDDNYVYQGKDGFIFITHCDTFHGWWDNEGMLHSHIEEFYWNGHKFSLSPEREAELKAKGLLGSSEWVN